MPQVFINGRFLTQGVTGVQRYGRETLHCLDQLLGQLGPKAPARFTVLAPTGTTPPPLSTIAFQTAGRLQGHAWEQIELPWLARQGLLFSFGFTGPLITRQQITTVHDGAVLRMPEAYTAKFRLWYNFMVRRLVARSPLTMAVSQFARSEAIECFGAPASRIRVATEGWQHLDRITADEGILDKHHLRQQPFVLAVSSPTPNKNFAAIVKALELMGDAAPTCVVAGSTNASIFKAATTSTSKMLRVGYVSDDELKALYRHAACFVFPSFYEGFGIPPLEAMSCGCPVIASTATAVKEVCGDAAMYFDPHQPQALAQCLHQFFADPGMGQRLAAAGQARAAGYSWQQGAALNLQAIAEALALGAK